jgi:hypothetical protein
VLAVAGCVPGSSVLSPDLIFILDVVKSSKMDSS